MVIENDASPFGEPVKFRWIGGDARARDTNRVHEVTIFHFGAELQGLNADRLEESHPTP